MDQTLIWQILLQIILIALNAVFACAEIAVISSNDSKMEQLASQGDKRAGRIVKFTSQPARFLATIQVAITLAGFLGSAFAADNFSDKLTNWLLGLGIPIPAATLDALSVILITVVLSYFTLIFGELVPKRLAMKKAEQLAMGMSALLTFVSKLFAPIVWILTLSTNGILRLLGVDPNADDDEVSEEEIRMMVDAGNRKGVIDPEENAFIQNVFEFDDITVGEFATHRTEIDFLWLDESLEQWEQIIHESRHTLYPICDETVDNVRGILNIKDYFALPEKTLDQVLKYAVKPAYFVPESIRADVLFKQMKKSHNHFAVVLDEYGGLVGIVTMNDLLEQLVGNLEEEITPQEQEQVEFQKIGDGVWQIGGGVSLETVAEELEVDLPPEADYETFGGFVFGMHGYIPDDGSQFELDTCGMRIEVLKIEGHRLKKAIVHYPA